MRAIKAEPIEEKDWVRGATETHLLILASGRRVLVDLCYDKEKWIMDDFRAAGAVEDLCFRLTRTAENMCYTVFTLSQPGESFKYISRWRRAVSFRAGPIMTRSLGVVSRIICQGRLEENAERDEDDYTIRVEISETEWDNDAPSLFLARFGSRWVDTVERGARLPEEVLALSSPFFLDRFYRRANERDKSFPIKGVTMNDIELALALSIEPFRLRMQRLRSMDMATLSSLLPACFLLSFNRIVSDLTLISLDLIHNCSARGVVRAMRLATVVGNQEAIPDLLSRFCLTGCLVRLLQENFDLLHREVIRAVTARLAELSRMEKERPLIRFSLDTGDVVVSLFSHEHERSCNELVANIRKHKQDVMVTRAFQTMQEGKGFVLRSALHPHERRELLFAPPSSFSSATSLFLLHTYSKSPRLFFSHCIGREDLVLGVVMRGEKTIDAAKHLQYISVC